MSERFDSPEGGIDSCVTLHRGGTTLTGPDAMLYLKALQLRGGLSVFIKTEGRLIPTRGVTGPVMLKLCKEFTAKDYKRGQYALALEDLENWIQTMKAALPVEDKR